jgi:hypothetical protein
MVAAISIILLFTSEEQANCQRKQVFIGPSALLMTAKFTTCLADFTKTFPCSCSSKRAEASHEILLNVLILSTFSFILSTNSPKA